MSTYRLKYFNSRGFAEIPRLLFALAGVKYEDCRFDRDSWPNEKKFYTPFGVMPVLQIDDKKQYGQSGAISRYLARTFKLYGQTDIDGLEIEQVLGIVQDMYVQMMKLFDEKDKTVQETVKKEGKEDKIPTLLRNLETILKDKKTGYFVGNSVTLADIAVFDACDKIEILYQISLDDFPEIKNSRDMVGAIPEIKAWVEKRPCTEH